MSTKKRGRKPKNNTIVNKNPIFDNNNENEINAINAINVINVINVVKY